MTNFTIKSDLKIASPSSGEKNTLYLTSNGDISVCSGREKLITQMIRAIVNDNTVLRNIINSTAVTTRQIFTLVNLILRNFKGTQVDEVNSIDTTFSGYYFYRKAAGTNDSYVKITKTITTSMFSDSSVTNGTTYQYGLTRVNLNVLESNFVDSFTATPTAVTANRKIYFGNSSICIENNNKVDFYVIYNDTVQRAELLNNILAIIPYQDSTEPRKFNVNISISDLSDNLVDISTQKIKA